MFPKSIASDDSNSAVTAHQDTTALKPTK
jgi:hypothetical protein